VESAVDVERVSRICRQIIDHKMRLIVIVNPHEPGIASNVNYAVAACSKHWIHLLFYDDFLIGRHFYERCLSSLENGMAAWLVTRNQVFEQSISGMQRPSLPSFNESIRLGVNSVGPPSAVIVRRDCWVEMSPLLSLFVDCGWYVSLKDVHGLPVICESSLVASTSWHGQTQHDRGVWRILRELIHLLQLSAMPSKRLVTDTLAKFWGDRNILLLFVLMVALSVRPVLRLNTSDGV
jgi:hypothetical protein